MLEPTIPRRALIWPPVVDAIRAAAADDEDVYIVGGAVRDAYLHRPLHDLDLATSGDGRPLARRIANAFDGAYYPLDAERGVGRALIRWEDAQLTVDTARFRGPDLLTDLQKRDFTLNAMAVRLIGDLQAVIDPLGGLADLDARRLRRCGEDSIASDPVRALRAVRTSAAYGLLIDPATRQDIKTHAPRLASASPERVRDEFFHILDGKRPATALETLNRLGLLAPVVPETTAMQDAQQGPPHQFDVWRHTLVTVERLDALLRVFSQQRDDDLTANLQLGVIAFSLQHLQAHLQAHLAQHWPNNRTHRALLVLAALLHDAGKPATRSVDDEGRVHFYQHEHVGAELAEQRAAALRLSNDETARLLTIVQHHMRPHWLSTRATLSARASYRFWRDTGPAGVDVCLLSMADYLATFGIMLDQTAWIAYLEMQQTLLNRYFLEYETAIAPPPLITGRDLLQHFQLEPEPLIGTILESVREAQVTGDVSTREEALDWVQRFLDASS
ncbi:MAG: HD domain-containing protein [Anaerolineae bacterium]|nr:HD domain-containing protein [Anaerolineae bacterium]